MDSPHDPSAAAGFLAEADEAMRRQVWELAIQKYHAALKASPANSTAYLGLGRAYERKAGDDRADSFLLLAMEHYRNALRADPGSRPVYDAMISLAVKTKQLENLPDDFRRVQGADGENPVFQQAMRQVRSLLMMQLDTVNTAAPPRGLSWFLLERILPLASIGCIVLSPVLSAQRFIDLPARVSLLSLTTGGLLMLSYILYKVLSRQR